MDEMMEMLEEMAKILPDIDDAIEREQIRLDAMKEYRNCIALLPQTFQEMILAKAQKQTDLAKKKSEELSELFEKVEQLKTQLFAKLQTG